MYLLMQTLSLWLAVDQLEDLEMSCSSLLTVVLFAVKEVYC